jgi:hypothetical protein
VSVVEITFAMRQLGRRPLTVDAVTNYWCGWAKSPGELAKVSSSYADNFLELACTTA